MKHSTPNHNKMIYACNILYRESFSGLFMYCWQKIVIYLKLESDDLIYVHTGQWLPQSK